MGHVDSSGLGRFALAAAVAGAITGLIDKSGAWLMASAAVLALWGLLYIFSAFPCTYTKFISWLEDKYEQSSPGHHRSTTLRMETLPPSGNTKDILLDTQINSSLSPIARLPRLKPRITPQAPAHTETDETYALKRKTRELVHALGC